MNLVVGDSHARFLGRYLSSDEFHVEGHDGITTFQLLRDAEWQLMTFLTEANYQTCVLIVGANDASAHDAMANLTALVNLCQRHVDRVYISTWPGGPAFDHSKSSFVISWDDDDNVAGKLWDTRDGVHLTDEGYRTWAAHIRRSVS